MELEKLIETLEKFQQFLEKHEIPCEITFAKVTKNGTMYSFSISTVGEKFKLTIFRNLNKEVLKNIEKLVLSINLALENYSENLQTENAVVDLVEKLKEFEQTFETSTLVELDLKASNRRIWLRAPIDNDKKIKSTIESLTPEERVIVNRNCSPLLNLINLVIKYGKILG